MLTVYRHSTALASCSIERIVGHTDNARVVS